jgi:hypothetical protein
MSLSISISDDAERMLRDHAQKAGLPPEALAARLLERSVRKLPDLVAISGQIGEAFKRSGMTEDELSELLEAEKHAMRAENRRKSA